MKRFLALFMGLTLSLSVPANAGLADWLINDLNGIKAKILRTWARACSYAPGGCSGWAGNALGIYVLGPDGAAIYRSTSTSAVNFTSWTTPGGCWSYDGGSWCASSAGTGKHYYGQLCARSTIGPGVLLAMKYAVSGSFVRGAVCNFSPYVSFPYVFNPGWFDINVCGAQSGNTAWTGKHEIIFSGDDSRHYAVLSCNQHSSFGKFSEFSSMTLTGPWPESSFDNRGIVGTLAGGLQAMLDSSDTAIVAQGKAIESDVADSIAALVGGVEVPSGVDTNSFFNNPFLGIDTSGNYVSVVSSVYVVGISSVVVDVNVVSSVSVSIDLDGLSVLVDTPAYVGEYELAISSGWGSLSAVADTVSGSLSTLFDFTGVVAWDGCFSFKVGDVPFAGVPLGGEETRFCLSQLPGWDNFALPLFKAILLIGTFLMGLFWLFE